MLLKNLSSDGLNKPIKDGVTYAIEGSEKIKTQVG